MHFLKTLTGVDTDGDGVGDNGDNCPESENAGQKDSDANGAGDACDAMPLVYSAAGNLDGGSDNGVSYTGQTARLVLQEKLKDYMEDLVEQEGEFDIVSAGLRFYVTGDGVDDVNHGFTTKGGDPVIPGPTYADISSGKNLNGKIAGGNLSGGGETGKLINDEFFGWSRGSIARHSQSSLFIYGWTDWLMKQRMVKIQQSQSPMGQRLTSPHR